MKPAASSPDQTYLESIREQVRAIHRRRPSVPPATEPGWQARLKLVREGLYRSVGQIPDSTCELLPEILGTIHRDGFVIERLTFQSRPGIRVTANLYRPTSIQGRVAAVLCVHGHWAWARTDPNVQARCLGLVKLGYVVLAIDAFGAGERAIDPKPGTYHGALDGASLWPTGVSLLGLQVYDNRRAVDYLISRPEVDSKQLAITGASGGGNQSLYAGALDDRLAAVVPVCGIGTYESYLGTGCCVCEMNVGGLTYAITGDLLAMIAPRALLIINATQDAVQFSVAEAAKSVAFARPRFQLLGSDAKLRHVPIESGHAYNQAMREVMYGWLDQWLRGKGAGKPVTEPAITLEDPQVLRCYPDGPSRPKSIVTIPQFALSEGRVRLAALTKPPDHPERWEADANHLRSGVRACLSSLPSPPDPGIVPRMSASGATERTLWTRSNQELRGRRFAGATAKATTLLIRHEGETSVEDPLVKTLRDTDRAVYSVDLSAIGRQKPAGGAVHGVTDHSEAEWGLWVGRPLLAQWVDDVIDWIDMIAAQAGKVEVVGVGTFGLVGLLAAGSRPTLVDRIGLLNPLISFVGDDTTPWSGLPMGLIVPNLLKIADVDQLTALVAPTRLTIAGAVEPSGQKATPARFAQGYSFTRAVYNILQAKDHLTIGVSTDPADFVRRFAEV